jgi:hypothetical protein
MNEAQAGHAHLRQDAAGSHLSALQAEVLTVLQAADGSQLRTRQVLDRLPGRGPASFRAVAAALQYLHAVGLASREPDERGVWLYTASGGSFPAFPAGPRSLGTLLGLGPLETAIMQVAWDANGWLTVTEYAGDLIAALLDHSPHPAAVLAHALAATPAGPRAGILIEASPQTTAGAICPP